MDVEIEMIERARALSEEAHEGQVDKAGKPYAEHSARVASLLAAKHGAAHASVVVGFLHDVVEDTPVALERIEQEFGVEIAAAVDAITRREGEASDDYYGRVRQNPYALEVKFADLADNSSDERLALLDAETAERLRRKYEHARQALR